MVEKLPRNARRDVDPCDLPSVVLLEAEAIDATTSATVSAPPTQIRMCTELDRKRVVYVEATAEILHYIRVAAFNAYEKEQDRVSRKRNNPVGVPGIMYDKRRNAVFAWMKDPAQPMLPAKRIQRKIRDDHASIQCAAQELKEHVETLRITLCSRWQIVGRMIRRRQVPCSVSLRPHGFIPTLFA